MFCLGLLNLLNQLKAASGEKLKSETSEEHLALA